MGSTVRSRPRLENHSYSNDDRWHSSEVKTHVPPRLYGWDNVLIDVSSTETKKIEYELSLERGLFVFSYFCQNDIDQVPSQFWGWGGWVSTSKKLVRHRWSFKRFSSNSIVDHLSEFSTEKFASMMTIYCDLSVLLSSKDIVLAWYAQKCLISVFVLKPYVLFPWLM